MGFKKGEPSAQTANSRADNITSLVSPVTGRVLFFLIQKRTESELEMLTDTTKQTPIFMRKLKLFQSRHPISLHPFLRLLFNHFSCVGKPPGQGVQRGDNVAEAGRVAQWQNAQGLASRDYFLWQNCLQGSLVKRTNSQKETLATRNRCVECHHSSRENIIRYIVTIGLAQLWNVFLLKMALYPQCLSFISAPARPPALVSSCYIWSRRTTYSLFASSSKSFSQAQSTGMRLEARQVGEAKVTLRTLIAGTLWKGSSSPDENHLTGGHDV